MIVVAGFLIWDQTKLKPNIWIQSLGILLFFYGMSQLSSKTPSKNQENQENQE